MTLGCLGKWREFPTSARNIIKNKWWLRNFKCPLTSKRGGYWAHIKRDNREAEGNALTDYYVKQAVLTKVGILTKLPKDKYLEVFKEAIVKYQHLAPDSEKEE